MSKLPASIDLNPPGGEPEASIIWLHGLGADGNDFLPISDQLGLQTQVKTRFVFPHAPVRSITINHGMSMRAWYDIFEMDLSLKEDSQGIENSAELIQLLIEREIDLGVPSHRIILAGFSQGSAMSLYTGLRFSKPLGGIVALSGYLPLAPSFSKERHPANQKIPIFMAHGLFDPVVPLMLGEMSRQQLQGLNYEVEWHTYSMPHTVLPEEISDIGLFLKRVLLSNTIS